MVEDTKQPVITLKAETVTITEGDEYDPKSNIESVVDEIDGALEYELDNQVDTSKVGEYTVALKAVDKNGNTAKQSFVINVEKKPLPKKQYNGNRNTWNAKQGNNATVNTWTANTNTGQQSYQNNGGNPSNNGGNDLWDIPWNDPSDEKMKEIQNKGNAMANGHQWGVWLDSNNDVISWDIGGN